jgi:ABC-type transport system involved in multi-copper enzyme maturation permease subunit
MSTQALRISVFPAINLSASGILSRPNQRLRPLFAVVAWEARRIFTSRVNRFVTFLAFVLLLALTWFEGIGYDVGHAFTLAGTSLFGLANVLPQNPGLLFGMLLPFLTVDGIALDLKRRTSDLVMSSAIPTWAYVWGRYIAVMLMSLGLAFLVALDIIIVTLALHASQPDVYPALNLPAVLAIWAVIFLPSALLIGSVSFALGTLFPRQSTLVKLSMLLAWFICGWIVPHMLIQSGLPSWVALWDPTSNGATYALTSQFFNTLTARTDGLSQAAFLQQARALEQRVPDLSAWVFPRLAWVCLGLAMVSGAARSFRRFRNAHV